MNIKTIERSNNSSKRINQSIQSWLRPVSLNYDVFGYADASVLFQIGNTKVLCSVSLIQGIPKFLRGKNTGWLTAEYAMLPTATRKRTHRESTQQKRNARSVEISRLIGRSLRSVVDMNGIEDKTIIIDCDVVQADGGTRVASVTAASCALVLAQKRWLKSNIIDKIILKESIAAISVGIVNNEILLDLHQEADAYAQADFNFILTESGNIIEVQGTAEQEPIVWTEFDAMRDSARAGIKQLFQECAKFSYNVDDVVPLLDKSARKEKTVHVKPDSLFSLVNR